MYIWEPGGSSPPGWQATGGPKMQPWSPGVSVNSEKGRGLWRWRPRNEEETSRAGRSSTGEAEPSPLFSVLLCHTPGPLLLSEPHSTEATSSGRKLSVSLWLLLLRAGGDSLLCTPAVVLGRHCCGGCCTKWTWSFVLCCGLPWELTPKGLRSPPSKGLLPSPHGAPAL